MDTIAQTVRITNNVHTVEYRTMPQAVMANLDRPHLLSIGQTEDVRRHRLLNSSNKTLTMKAKHGANGLRTPIPM